MLKILKCDLARIISIRGFTAAIIMTAVLCFSVQVFSDSTNGKAYSAFEALLTLKRDFMALQSHFSPPVIISKALSGYSSMLLPITASFPFVLSFTAEKNSGNILCTISRTSRMKYCISKFITSVLSGGLCTLFGVILFGIFVYVLFPNADPSDLQAFSNGVFPVLVKKAISTFVFGMTSVLPAFFICSFCSNPYIILCVPFMLKFILETILSKLQANGDAAGNISVYEQLAPFSPNAASSLIDRPVNKTFLIIIVVNVVFAAAVFAGFTIITERRMDRGRLS